VGRYRALNAQRCKWYFFLTLVWVGPKGGVAESVTDPILDSPRNGSFTVFGSVRFRYTFSVGKALALWLSTLNVATRCR
jgi:hypothetical protein